MAINKYIHLFQEIYFELKRNTFSNLDKYKDTGCPLILGHGWTQQGHRVVVAEKEGTQSQQIHSVIQKNKLES